jgi:hypothetical protein
MTTRGDYDGPHILEWLVSIIAPDDFLHPSVDDAIQALRRLGADHEPRFDMHVEHEHFGTVKRVYGILGNVLDKKGYVDDPIIVERLLNLVNDPENERILRRLESGKMNYTPINKRALRYLATALEKSGVHLPWTWRPMNFDFAALASKIHRQSPLPFVVFHSQQVTTTAAGVSPTRIFSLPVEGHAQGTWAEPISDEMLDPDVGLILEADAR